MAILDSKNDQQALPVFKIASGLETATVHFQTLLNGICQAVEDKDEAMTLTLVESARHFVMDIEQLKQALPVHVRTERDMLVDFTGASTIGRYRHFAHQLDQQGLVAAQRLGGPPILATVGGKDFAEIKGRRPAKGIRHVLFAWVVDRVVSAIPLGSEMACWEDAAGYQISVAEFKPWRDRVACQISKVPRR